MQVHKETLEIYGSIINVDVVYLDINIGDPVQRDDDYYNRKDPG